MDPLSQALVGTGFAGSFCKKREWIKPAMLAGVVGGTVPDLDILIQSKDDQLLFIEYHRHFTHALIFTPIGGLFAALLCWWPLRKKLTFKWIYIFAFLGYATHGVLDSMTNYGTHLLWPFTDRRESWSIISIIDPIFTFIMLCLCVAAYGEKSRNLLLASMLFASLYWSFGFYQRESATSVMFEQAKTRGHTPEYFEVKPSFANIILWRTQYEYDGKYYIDAVRVLPFSEKHWYAGESIEVFNIDKTYPNISKDSRQYKDYKRFAHFSDGWLSAIPGRPHNIGDMRYSSFPNGIEPLWGVRLSPDKPQKGVIYINLRRSDTAHFTAMWQMIQGKYKTPNQD